MSLIPDGYIRQDQCYTRIASFYHGKKANRSEVPLIHHINEGLLVLDRIKASYKAKQAYCLHPLYQNDAELVESVNYTERDSYVIILVMEYRRTANAFLSKDFGSASPLLSPLEEVNDMLVADKVQNRKDFEKYNLGISNAKILKEYFKLWLEKLGVDEDTYRKLSWKLEEANVVSKTTQELTVVDKKSFGDDTGVKVLKGETGV